MNHYPEVKQIAECVSRIDDLVKKLSDDGLDTDDIDWKNAEIVTLDERAIQYFKSHNGETEDYYVVQHQGGCEDCYWGQLYFKTDVPDKYVKVNFSM